VQQRMLRFARFHGEGQVVGVQRGRQKRYAERSHADAEAESVAQRRRGRLVRIGRGGRTEHQTDANQDWKKPLQRFDTMSQSLVSTHSSFVGLMLTRA